MASAERYTGPFLDLHTHCRDGPQQSHKATIKSTTDLAASKGFVGVCDMPNTSPPLLTKKDIEARLHLAKSEGCGIGYYVYGGVTEDRDQLKEVAELAMTNPKVVGLKMYAGKSTGNLTVASEDGQRQVYRLLAHIGYTGVLVVHCEDETQFKMSLWNPKQPKSWNDARPPHAEIVSIRTQIRLAQESGFKGKLHIAHVSTPEGLDEVSRHKDTMSITCGVTPHHLLFSTDDMEGADGLMYKVNPPLRSPETRKGLLRRVAKSVGNWIMLETDHAPHTEEEKMRPKNGEHASGIPSLNNYEAALDLLRSEGITEERIAELGYHNVKALFPKIRE